MDTDWATELLFLRFPAVGPNSFGEIRVLPDQSPYDLDLISPNKALTDVSKSDEGVTAG
jgi:hypothetical protein